MSNKKIQRPPTRQRHIAPTNRAIANNPEGTKQRQNELRKCAMSHFAFSRILPAPKCPGERPQHFLECKRGQTSASLLGDHNAWHWWRRERESNQSIHCFGRRWTAREGAVMKYAVCGQWYIHCHHRLDNNNTRKQGMTAGTLAALSTSAVAGGPKAIRRELSPQRDSVEREGERNTESGRGRWWRRRSGRSRRWPRGGEGRSDRIRSPPPS